MMKSSIWCDDTFALRHNIFYQVSILLSVGVLILFMSHCRKYTEVNGGIFHVEVWWCGIKGSVGIIG
jgi:hypothetical protein